MEIRIGRVLFALIAIIAGFGAHAADVPAHGVDQAQSDSAQPLTWLKSGDYAALDRYYSDLQKQYEAGGVTDQMLYAGFRKLYEDSATNDQYFNSWVTAFPASYPARVARGAYFYRMAWFVRGDEYMDKTSASSVAEMVEYLERSEPDLMASLKMTAKPFLSTLYLLNVKILRGSDDERRHWFDEGIRIDPASTTVRTRYMFSLRPRWYGSYEEMQQFLAECEQQHLDPKFLASLSMQIHFDMAEDAMRADKNAGRTGSSAEVFNQWGQVLKLAAAAGDEPPTEALAGYTGAAWDQHKRTEADWGLEQLAKRDIHDGWSLGKMAWVLMQEHRDAEALPVLRKAAEKKEPWSQFALGATLYKGCPEINLAPNQPDGLVWIRRAAKQCNQDAINFLSAHGQPAQAGCNSQRAAGAQAGSPADILALYTSWSASFLPWRLGIGFGTALLVLLMIRRRNKTSGDT
jgi:hypothetical protein